MNPLDTDFNFVFKPEPFTLSPNEKIAGEVGKSIFIVEDRGTHFAPLKELSRYSLSVFSSFHEVIALLKAPAYCPLPEAIIGYYEEDLTNDIAFLGQLLLQRGYLRHIPFILLTSEGGANKSTSPKHLPGVDALISTDLSAAEIEEEIKIIKKLKKFSVRNREEIHPEKDLGLPSNKNKFSNFIKRSIDITAALILLCLLLPLMLLIAIIIKLESRGPVIYAANRSGSDYRIFKFLKFRSMYQDADKQLSTLSNNNQYGKFTGKGAVFFKISDDPRITKFGKFLRNTSLDELPQLINVLKGDMSIVGNRPLPLYEAKTLTTDRYAERFNAPAGITGLWQVTKRGQKEMSAEERIALDIHYARHHSFLYDMKIILSTPKALSQKDDV